MSKPVVFEYVLKGQIDKELNRVTLALKGIGDESYSSFNRLKVGSAGAYSSLKKMAGAVGIGFGVKQLLDFAGSVADVRAEIEASEISLGVLLGSEEKQKKMLSEITRMTQRSPFSIKEYTEAAQTLLGFNVEAEKTVPIMKAIGDISMGNKEKFKSLNLAFAQMSSLGRLVGNDLLQMVNAGFNPLSVISEKTGKSIAALRKEMESGSISAKMVEDAFMSAAGAGGKYNNMLEKQMEGILGGKAEFQNAILSVQNDLGKMNEDVITGVYKSGAALVRNYQTIGKAILGLVAVYGGYRVAVGLVTAAEKGWTVAQLANYRALLLVEKAQKLLKASMLTNPYVLATTAIIGLVAGLTLLGKRTKSTAEIVEGLQKATDNYDNSLKELNGDISRYEELQAKAKTSAGLSETEHKELNGIMERMLITVPNLRAEFDEYGKVLKINSEDLSNYSKKQLEANRIAIENQIKSGKERKTELEKQLEERRKIFQDGYIDFDSYTPNYNRPATQEKKRVYYSNDAKVKASGEFLAIQDELNGLNAELQQSTDLLDGVVKSLNDSGDETAKILNEAHWKTVKKLAEEAIAAMDVSEKGTAKWVEQQKLYNEAVRNLKAYDHSTKADTKYESDEQKRLDASMKLLEKNKQITEDTLRFENDMEQKRIDLKNDSFQKRQAQNDLNYKKEKEAADKFGADKLKALREAERLAWEEEGSKGVFTSAIAVLPAEYEAQVEKMKELAKQGYDRVNAEIARDVGTMWQEERNRFADELTQQLMTIEAHYEERIKQAEGNEALIAELTRNKQTDIELATATHAAEMIRFDSNMALRRMELSNDFYLFESDRRKKYLEEQKRAAEEELRILEDAYSKMPTSELEKEIKELKQRLAEFNKELGEMPVQRLREALSSVRSLASAFSGLGGEIGEMFSAITDQIDNIEVAFDKTASGIDRISGGISGAIGIINMLTSASAKRKATEKEFYKNAIAFAHEYALALNEQLRLQSANAASGFITDYAGQINDSFNALTDATRGYNEALAKLAEGKAKIDLRDSVDWGNIGKGTASGAALGAAVGSVVPVIGTAVGAVVGAVGGFFAGLFGGKKKKNKYGGLLDIFPELVDGAGNLNRELAEALVNTEQLDDETKQLVANALDWADAVEEAQAQIRDIVVELSGDLGNNLRSAIVDAWKAGEDASVAMFDKASEGLEKFVEQMLYSVVFGDIFKAFEDDLVASLNPDTGDGDVVDDFERFMKQMDSRDESYIAMLEAIKRRAKERGFDLWKSDLPEEEGTTTVKPSSKGLRAVSQDSFDEGMGKVTALVIYASDRNKMISGFSGQMGAATDKLSAIAENSKHLQRLEQMEKDTKEVKKSLSSIVNNGITLKK